MQALKCIFFLHTFSQLHIFNVSRIFRIPAQPRLTRSARSTAVDFLKLIAVARSGFFWPQISQKMWLAPFLPHTPTQSPWRASYFTQFITVEREITPRHVTVSRSACEVVTRSQVCRRIRSSKGQQPERAPNTSSLICTRNRGIHCHGLFTSIGYQSKRKPQM